jgi:hypothetical protein
MQQFSFLSFFLVFSFLFIETLPTQGPKWKPLHAEPAIYQAGAFVSVICIHTISHNRCRRCPHLSPMRYSPSTHFKQKVHAKRLYHFSLSLHPSSLPLHSALLPQHVSHQPFGSWGSFSRLILFVMNVRGG